MTTANQRYFTIDDIPDSPGKRVLLKILNCKYKVHPQFIRIKDLTMDVLLDEAEKNYMNLLNSEHSILDSEDEEIVPVRRIRTVSLLLQRDLRLIEMLLRTNTKKRKMK